MPDEGFIPMIYTETHSKRNEMNLNWKLKILYPCKNKNGPKAPRKRTGNIIFNWVSDKILNVKKFNITLIV